MVESLREELVASLFVKEKIKILDLLDYLVPAVALGQSIGRWGNFWNIEAYGRETASFFEWAS